MSDIVIISIGQNFSVFKPILNIALSLLLSLPLLQVKSAGPTDYCYLDSQCGPSSWEDDCKYGYMQSPINLESSRATKIQKSVSLLLNRDYAMPQTFNLMNDGRTVRLFINADGSSTCQLRGQSFLPNEPYSFYQLHFHWGPNDNTGSEHSIDGKKFPLELHMIHRQDSDNSKYAAFGILFKLSNTDNSALNPILNSLQFVSNYTNGSIIPIPPQYLINLRDLLPKKIKAFRYQGSFTVPPCSESVTWTVFDDFMTVSRRQLRAFRNILGNDFKPIQINSRPIQTAFTGKRPGYYYLKTANPSTGNG